MAAAQKIGYANKQSGALWTSSNANEVKAVVNNNADELDATNARVATIGQSVTSLTNNVNTLNEKAQVGIVQQTDLIVSINPNKLNVWGNVASLRITFLNGDVDVANEYMLQFTPSSDSFTLTFTDGVIWMEEPEFEAGYTYQVSILNGLAIYAEWENQQ